MRVALLDPTPKRRAGIAGTANIPAPTGGWNTRDSLAEMPALDATVLDNWFPRSGQCQLRGGSSVFASGMTGTIKTVMQYQPASGTKKLYAVTNSGIYDVTAGGAIGAAAQALTNGYFNSVNFANSAGTAYLWGCNGTDTPKYWDGAAWATPTITGIATPANLIWPVVFKHRIFAIEKNSMNLWYLPIDAIQGLAAVLPYGNILKGGGQLQSTTSWTLDAGDGSDDLIAVVSTEGELAIYKGIDPSSASSWELVGVWRTGKPVGRRCFQKLGGDVVILTENGVFPLSRLLRSGNINYASALSNKIQSAFTSAVKTVGITIEGWEATVYPQYDALITNIPVGAMSPSAQFVMNTTIGSWCSFSGWTAYCFQVYEGVLYFGGASGNLYKAWDGTLVSDSDIDITATVKTAYNYFGSKTRLKLVNLFRLLLLFDEAIEIRWGVSPDYTNVGFNSLDLRGNSLIGSAWDTFYWNTTYWAGTAERFKLWRSAAHSPGYALALWLQVITNSANVAWSGTDYILADGGAI